MKYRSAIEGDICERMSRMTLQELEKFHLSAYATEIVEAAGKLFVSRGLVPEGDTFEYFVSRVVPYIGGDPTTKSGILSYLSEGYGFLVDQFMEDSLRGPVMVKDYCDELLHDALAPMCVKVPQDWGGQVGKGEFMLMMLIPQARLAKRGDLEIGDEIVEVKGNSSRFCSQMSHATPNSIKEYVFADLKKIMPKVIPVDLPNFNAKGFEQLDYFVELNGTSEDDYGRFIADTMSRFSVHWPRSEFNWIEGFVDETGFDHENWRPEQAIAEFEYYKDVEHFNRLIIVNTDSIRAVSVTNSDQLREFLPYFSVGSQYIWNGEKLKTSTWLLRPK